MPTQGSNGMDAETFSYIHHPKAASSIFPLIKYDKNERTIKKIYIKAFTYVFIKLSLKLLNLL